MWHNRRLIAQFVVGLLSLGILTQGPSAVASVPRQAADTPTATATAGGPTDTPTTSAATATSTTVAGTPVATDTATAAAATDTPVAATATSTSAAPATTDTPTATAVATATTAPTPLGAPARLVASTTLKHRGKTATVTWRMAYQLGMKGFRIYAQKHNLTPKLIKPHRSPNYTAHVAWVSGGKYALHMYFKNGHSQTLAIH
jgi:hypothetical protein